MTMSSSYHTAFPAGNSNGAGPSNYAVRNAAQMSHLFLSLLSPPSCLLSPVSCLLSPVSCLLSPLSRLLSSLYSFESFYPLPCDATALKRGTQWRLVSTGCNMLHGLHGMVGALPILCFVLRDASAGMVGGWGSCLFDNPTWVLPCPAAVYWVVLNWSLGTIGVARAGEASDTAAILGMAVGCSRLRNRTASLLRVTRNDPRRRFTPRWGDLFEIRDTGDAGRAAGGIRTLNGDVDGPSSSTFRSSQPHLVVIDAISGAYLAQVARAIADRIILPAYLAHDNGVYDSLVREFDTVAKALDSNGRRMRLDEFMATQLWISPGLRVIRDNWKIVDREDVNIIIANRNDSQHLTYPESTWSELRRTVKAVLRICRALR
ncbi:hypothetical protein P7C73_g4534, partial [Tremellales sp. Uapishka_1]